MGKVKTIIYEYRDRDIESTDRGLLYRLKYDVYCDKDGIFSTTLPKDFVNEYEATGLEMASNRMGTSGYIHSESLKGLAEKVENTVKELFQKEVVSDTLVIRYSFNTYCHYCINEKGDILANGDGVEDWKNVNAWRNGTEDHSSMSVKPYGFAVGVHIQRKIVYRHLTGRETSVVGKAEESQLCEDGKFLKRLIRINHGRNTQEMEYTPERAKFFADLIRGICTMNERIKDMVTDPVAMIGIADSGKKLLL